jgi:hypothetical protein
MNATTTLVCARYNEDLTWLLPLKNESILIYNKGEDNIDNFPENKIIKLPNLGREGGTYLHHIIANYDNLSDYTLFTQANPVDHVFNYSAEKSYKQIFDAFSEKKSYNFKYISTFFIKASKTEVTNYCSGMPHLGYNYCPPVKVKTIIDCVMNMKKTYPLINYDLSLFIRNLEEFPDANIQIYELTQLISKNKAFTVGNNHDERRRSLYANFDLTFFLNTLGDDYAFGYGAIFVVSKKQILVYPKSFWETIYSTFQDIKPGAGWGLEKMWRYIFDDHYIMLNTLKNMPDLKMSPLKYVMENVKLKHKPGTLWIELGIGNGNTINYISRFTKDKVYGFDSFEGLPEKWRDGFNKGMFSTNGILPNVNSNVELIKGGFSETLRGFVQSKNKKISFIHFDCALYSSTKCALNALKNRIDNDCIMIFDEFVNYPGFAGNGELRAFYEFAKDNAVDYEWIGMEGTPFGMSECRNEKVALIIKSMG